jgi:hypothetical protein
MGVRVPPRVPIFRLKLKDFLSRGVRLYRYRTSRLPKYEARSDPIHVADLPEWLSFRTYIPPLAFFRCPHGLAADLK